jgi:valyl-tRNA synthetase
VPAVVEAPGYEATRATIAHLARMDLGADGAAPVASVAVPGGTVGVLPSEEVDLEAAERRLEARREELRREVRRAEGKLGNEKFVSRAPEHVVEAERLKLARLTAELEAL